MERSKEQRVCNQLGMRGSLFEGKCMYDNTLGNATRDAVKNGGSPRIARPR